MIGVTSPISATSTHAAMWDVSRLRWKNRLRICGMNRAAMSSVLTISVCPIGFRHAPPRVSHV
jgi:hypothetical protein